MDLEKIEMGFRRDEPHELASPHILLHPQVDEVLEIIDVASDDDISFGHLAREMRAHPAIAAAVIRAANAANLGNSQQTRSLSHALGMIGMYRIRSLLAEMEIEARLRQQAGENQIIA